MNKFKNGDNVYFFDYTMNIINGVFDEYWEYEFCYITTNNKSESICPDRLFLSKEELLTNRISELSERILRTPDAIRDLKQRQEEDSKEIVALTEMLNKVK